MVSSQPYSVPFDLGTLRDQPVERTLNPGEAERAAIASWLGIGAVEDDARGEAHAAHSAERTGPASATVGARTDGGCPALAPAPRRSAGSSGGRSIPLVSEGPVCPAPAFTPAPRCRAGRASAG